MGGLRAVFMAMLAVGSLQLCLLSLNMKTRLVGARRSKFQLEGNSNPVKSRGYIIIRWPNQTIW